MDWTASILSIDDPEAQASWNGLWAAAPQRSPFSTLAFASAATGAFDLQGELHLIRAGAQVEAGALVFWRRRGPYREVVIPPFTPLTPFLFSTPPDEAALHARRSSLEALLQALEARFDVAQFHLHPSMHDVRVCRWRGWQATPFYTYQLPLSTASDLVDGWSEGTRRLFRNARTRYCIAEDPRAASHIASLCAASYARHDRPFPASSERVARIMLALQKETCIRLFTATRPGTTAPEGGLAVLHDDHTAYYWIAGSTPGAAMTALLGDVLPRLYEVGLSVFDFVGANTPPIAEFKRRFGARLALYFRIEKTMRPELRLVQRLRGC